MAKDLILGRVRRNWARGSCVPQISDEVTFKLTEPEMSMLADIASTKMLADMGDKDANKKMAGVRKKVKKLQKQARKGDPAAKRALLVLAESGVFRGVSSFTLGAWSAGENLVPNTTYRAAVVKHALRLANGKTPSTKHFWQAKNKVDGVMAEAGLSLYLPGARPGRITAGVPS